MAEKSKFIAISVELQRKIAERFNVSTRTIISAMHYKTNSPSARLFRSYALNNGGKLFEEVENPYDKAILK